jgi:hypothetical protein
VSDQYSAKRDIEIMGHALQALASEQQRISVNLNEIASKQQRISLDQETLASTQKRDIEIMGNALQALASEQQRISVNFDEVASKQQGISLDQDKFASEQKKIASEQKTLSRDLQDVLKAVHRIEAKGAWPERLGNVLYYAGLMSAFLAYLFIRNNAPTGGMGPDDWGILSVACAVLVTIGWTVRYLLSGKTNFPL